MGQIVLYTDTVRRWSAVRKFTWDEYYDCFYDWSPSTQKNYSYGLQNYGSADEVFEVA